jgi:polar amino acid transport system substrate-binding protein
MRAGSDRRRVGWPGIGVLAAVLAVVIGFLVFGVRDDEVFRVAYANEAPYGYLDTATGRVTGEAPEIARVILDRLGVENVEMVVTEFGSLIPGLKAGRFDMVAAGMYITPERCREIAFSLPTYAIGEAFLVRKGNPLDLHSYEDVAAHESARIGVMGGAVEHGYAKDLGVPEDRIVIFPDYPSALSGLRTGRIDALAATDLTVGDLLRKSGEDEFERAEPFTDPAIDGKVMIGYGAFGLRKEDRELLESIDRELSAFIGSKEHLDLVRPFGFSEATLPGDVTVEDLCRGE